MYNYLPVKATLKDHQLSIKSEPEKTSLRSTSRTPERHIIGRGEHQISRKNISPNCLKILYRLNEKGFQSFIVGGGVRDLLLDLHPKDFDIATNATPEQLRKIFSNSRIIGRRFRIVHVHFGREIIEVSTFRALPTVSVEIQGDSLSRKVKYLESAHSKSGMILRDNVYGDIEEDVMRRDFTANALYYTVQNFEIHDYVNGITDINNRSLRMIGNPLQRYREDPVRVLRALRFSAKLNFSIEDKTAAPIRECAPLLASIPSARLFDECLKLFFTGKAKLTYQKLVEYGVFDTLFPVTAQYLHKQDGNTGRLLENAFANTDKRVNQGQNVTPAFLLAAILWPPVQALFSKHIASGLPPHPAMHEAGQTVIWQQLKRIAIPKRIGIPMKEIWELQLRLPRRTGNRAETLLKHRRFRAAYDFVLLRESAGEDLQGLGQWWTEFQATDRQQRGKMQAKLMKKRHNSKSRFPR